MVFPRAAPFDESRVDQTTGLRKIFKRAGSPHPPEVEAATREDDYRYPEDLEEERQARQQELSRFAQLIRDKPRWFSKIRQQKDLMDKWLLESGIEDGVDLRGLIKELHQEAQRILIHDHSIVLESRSLPDRTLDEETIDHAVNAEIAYLRCGEYAIDEPELYEAVGAFTTDNIIPIALHAEVVRELDALAALGPRDYHPGSGGKVQDLIHPSLYPYMADVTPLHESATPPFAVDGQFVTCMRSKHPSAEDSVVFRSAYAWVPSVIKVSEDGARTTIDGYINGLGTRDQFPTLFRLIEQVFSLALPLLEKAFNFNFEHKWENPSFRRWQERRDFLLGAREPFDQEAWSGLLKMQAAARASEDNEIRAAKVVRAALKAEERGTFVQKQIPSSAPSRWAGQNLKVVIKAANYMLEPGQEHGGTWHIEGMPHERIVASAIYYYDRDDTIQDAGLYLRRRRDGELDFPNEEDHMSYEFSSSFKDESKPDGYFEIVNNPSDHGSDYGLGNMSTYINVGVIPTTKEAQTAGTGRIVAFPNWLQHRVVSLRNDSNASGLAVRKILCFFLVDNGDLDDEFDPTSFPGFEYDELDDEMHVLTTLDIPSQARACNLPTAAFLIRVAFRQRAGRFIPNELINLVLEGLQGPAAQLSREDAEKRRRYLMADRKVNARHSEQFWEEEWSLCEH